MAVVFNILFDPRVLTCDFVGLINSLARSLYGNEGDQACNGSYVLCGVLKHVQVKAEESADHLFLPASWPDRCHVASFSRLTLVHDRDRDPLFAVEEAPPNDNFMHTTIYSVWSHGG